MRKREAIQPREWKQTFFQRQQAVIIRPIGEAGSGFTGVLERSEYAKVKHTWEV